MNERMSVVMSGWSDAMHEAWRDFEADHLTDGEGHAPMDTYVACADAFAKGWFHDGPGAANTAALAKHSQLHRKPRSVLQDWVQNLPFMQQSVLLSAMRNADGVEKGHPSKDLIRWYRRCVVLSAFDGRALTDPTEPGGGSYTGPVADIEMAADDFLKARDGMSLHYYAHAMHAFQIVAYHHPADDIGEFWLAVYERMALALHLRPESCNDMDQRLGDNEDGWKRWEDKAGGCST